MTKTMLTSPTAFCDIHIDAVSKDLIRNLSRARALHFKITYTYSMYQGVTRCLYNEGYVQGLRP